MWIKPYENGVRFSVLIQTRSSKNEITGIQNNVLKLRLTAPPVKGAANKACVRFFAKWLGVSVSTVNIVQGLYSKNKTVEVTGFTEELFKKIIKNIKL
tara:strand:- start:335 stop:628 length:294 start_codon:yes stop_codon:yes gene_type:complete